MKLNIRDIVKCNKVKGRFKIIDLRKDEARIQNIDNPSEIFWMYLAHLSLDTKSTNIVKRINEISKILSKSKKKK